jgi:hypothetical protein
MKKPAFELAEIITKYKDKFLQEHKISAHHLRTLKAIEICRTNALGGHIDQCNTCKKIRISYNSCRNRHCPKCQSTEREKWIAAREKDLLDVKYYHVVFTVPHELNTYFLNFPAETYDILFSASKETLEVFACDEKHLGAQAGMIALLHTWGQNLSLHPHVHMIVPAGGMTPQGYWKNTKNKGNYLFPSMAMAVVFKNKMMEKIREFLKQKKIILPDDLRKLLYNKKWIVYAKQPFAGPKQVIEYLGRYTHKIAISNHRIKNIADDKVSFSYKDYADSGKQKTMTLSSTEFLRRFCLHILPKGFRKIRHYGFLASRNKPKLRKHQFMSGIIVKNEDKKNWKQIAGEKLNYDADKCPCCKKGVMERIVSFGANSPPEMIRNLIDGIIKK